jgi:uncharacterized protein (TIGR02246 family)
MREARETRDERRGLRLVAAMLLVTACASPSSSFTAAHRAAIVDSVQAMLVQWRDAVNSKDFARAGTFYSDDSAFRWYEDGQLTITSAQAVRNEMQSMLPNLRSFTLTLVAPRITPLGPGIATVGSEFTETITDTTGNAVGLAGALTATVVHERDSWRLLIGHNSSLRRAEKAGSTTSP